jgi:hypothetical protein
MSSKMTEIYNTNAHYTNNPKIATRKPTVAISPTQIPDRYTFNDEEANKRLRGINNEITQEYKTEKNKEKRKYFKFVSLTAICILAFLGLKKLFKKS